MKDVQREALTIETEMERRFSDMLNRNSQRRYLPKSLTDEIIEQKIKVQEQNINQQLGEAPEMPTVGYAQIREAITERLGGPFDYAELQSQIKDYK